MEKEPKRSSSLPRTGNVAVGHPVDVASGTLFHLFDDYTLPGRFPVSFKRRYSTGLLDRETAGIFGKGWSSPFEVRLYEDENSFVYLCESGEGEYTFAIPDSGELNDQPVLDAGSFADLTATDSEYCVTHWDPDNGRVTRDYFPRRSQAEPKPITRREDGEGNAIEFNYSQSSGLLKYIVQKREQRGLQLVYDDAGHLLQVRRKSSQSGEQDETESQKVWLQYRYDAKGMLETFTDPLGNQSHYKYDSSGYMISEITLAGKEWRFMFDEQGRCIVTTGKNKFDYHKLDYGNDKVRITKVEDSNGDVRQYHYNEAGQVLKQVSPLGHTSSTIFDAAGRIIQLITPEGRTTTYEYDNAGNRYSITTADGASLTYSFNEQHQAESMIDPAGQCWRMAYDSIGQAVSRTNPEGATQSFSYDGHGNLTSHQDAAGNTRIFHWDKHGNLVAASDWQGNTSHYEWDAFGALIAVRDPSGQVTTVRRDRLGRLHEVILPDGNRRLYQWDVFNNLTCFTDERNAATQWQYCDCGNIESELRADGSSINYHWQTIPGQLAAISNSKNEVFHFIHDADGRLVEEQDFSGAITRYEHDSDNNVVRTIKPSGNEVGFEYDGVGRLSRVSYSSGEETNYSYDICGRLQKAVNDTCEVSFEHDSLGRLIHEKQGKRELWHEYDELNRRTTRRTDRDDITDFNWTPNGLISSVHLSGRSAVEFDYDSRGIETNRRLESLTLNSKVDRRGLLVNQKLVSGTGNAVVERSYSYDAAGNLISGNDAQWGITNYVYDQLERITETLHPDKSTEYFQYDDADNISSYAYRKPGQPESGAEEIRLYGKGSQLLRKGKITCEYDADGQLITRQGPGGKSEFQWNHAGQMVSFINGSGKLWHYRYDALGRRTAKDSDGERHEYHWDGDVVLYEYSITEDDAEAVDCWEYHPHDFSPLYKASQNELHLCINDQIGTPMELVDGDGEIGWCRRYLTFGETRDSRINRIECNIRFQGQWFDSESGLSYNRFRYYSAESGGYISVDPIGLNGGLNTRLYALNTVNRFDVFGLAAKECKNKVYRYLSAEDRDRLEAGLGLEPKGTGGKGKVLAHVQGEDTGHISASQTREAAERFDSGNGFVIIDVKKATQGDTNFIDHNNVMQSVQSDSVARSDARTAREVLFRGPVPQDAISGPFFD